jgi:hypothetical protein
MHPKATFDLVITSRADEKDKILKVTEACQLQNGSAFTYVSNFTKNFLIEEVVVGRLVNYRPIKPYGSSF